MKLDICNVCKGDCCKRGNPYLSEKEKKLYKSFDSNKLNNNKGDCDFLSDKGCILKVKPLACRIYPFFPTKKGWILRTSCKFWDKITKEDLEKVKEIFEKEKENWEDYKYG